MTHFEHTEGIVYLRGGKLVVRDDDGVDQAELSVDGLTSPDIATQAELDAHAADSTSVHGITNTANLAAKNADNSFSTKQTFAGEVEIDGALNHDGSTVGFYGATPAAQQTGVAVTAEAIHAALVNLGLITA